MAEAKRTTNHDKIQKWVEKRGGKPACVRGTGGKGDTGVLRIDFPGYSGADTLQAIEWDEFFQKFDEQNLAFLYQDKTAGGKPSNFNKLVNRDSPASGGRGKKKAVPRQAATARTGGAKSAGTKKTAKKSAAGKAMSGAARKGTKKKAAKKASTGARTKKAPKRKKASGGR
jgi:hypothetical protein